MSSVGGVTAGPHLGQLGLCGVAPAVHLERLTGMSMTGTVKFFNTEKGYGFIKPDDGGKDIFVHISAVQRSGLASLSEGQKLAFELEADKRGKGPKAVNLAITS